MHGLRVTGLRPTGWPRPQKTRKSGLGNEKLRDIWNLVDVMKDGVLDADYFAVAMHLTMKVKKGQPLPTALPPELVPPAGSVR